MKIESQGNLIARCLFGMKGLFSARMMNMKQMLTATTQGHKKVLF